jgi:hypothetical protein
MRSADVKPREVKIAKSGARSSYTYGLGAAHTSAARISAGLEVGLTNLGKSPILGSHARGGVPTLARLRYKQSGEKICVSECRGDESDLF